MDRFQIGPRSKRRMNMRLQGLRSRTERIATTWPQKWRPLYIFSVIERKPYPQRFSPIVLGISGKILCTIGGNFYLNILFDLTRNFDGLFVRRVCTLQLQAVAHTRAYV